MFPPVPPVSSHLQNILGAGSLTLQTACGCEWVCVRVCEMDWFPCPVFPGHIDPSEDEWTGFDKSLGDDWMDPQPFEHNWSLIPDSHPGSRDELETGAVAWIRSWIFPCRGQEAPQRVNSWQKHLRGPEWLVLYARSWLNGFGERYRRSQRNLDPLFHLSHTRCPTVRLNITLTVMLKPLWVVQHKEFSVCPEQEDTLTHRGSRSVYCSNDPVWCEAAALSGNGSRYRASGPLCKRPVWAPVLRWDGPWVFSG